MQGITIEDVERRRTLVMAVMLGHEGAKAVGKVAERTGQHWARQLARGIPNSKILAINKVLGRNFVTKYGTKQGILVLGRVLPFGIGAVIGGPLTRSSAKESSQPPTVHSEPHHSRGRTDCQDSNDSVLVGVTHLHVHRAADMEHVAKLDDPSRGLRIRLVLRYVIRARDSMNEAARAWERCEVRQSRQHDNAECPTRWRRSVTAARLPPCLPAAPEMCD